MADQFQWDFGHKEVIIHEVQLGLKRHIYFCADLANRYENVIILEDDLFVSPHFYEYAKQALSFYQDEDRIAGISLYGYPVTEHLHFPFNPIDDGADVYFLQMASSWGQLLTKVQWNRFKEWNKQHESEFDESSVPAYIKNWGENSWKKHFVHYLIENKKYFVYPRLSLSTNFNEGGNHADPSVNFQTAIQNTKKEYVFSNISQSKAIYDPWFEITPEGLNKLVNSFSQYNYEVDLYGTKESYRKEHVLTTRKTAEAVYSFSAKMTPILQNILSGAPGNAIRFAPSRSVEITANNHRNDPFFTWIIPVIELNNENILLSIQSIFSVDHRAFHIMLIHHSDITDELEELIAKSFGDRQQDIGRSQTDTRDVGKMLKEVFDRVNAGILGWLLPGETIHEKTWLAAGEIFSNYPHINWLTVEKDEEAIRQSRLNLPVLYLLLSQKESFLFPGRLLFRSHSWKTISPQLNATAGDEFFSGWILHIVNGFDLHSVLADNDTESKKVSTFISREKIYGLIDQISVDTSVKKKMRQKVIFRLLKYLYIKQIPGFKNLFGMYYDLPAVLRKDPATESYYLSKY